MIQATTDGKRIMVRFPYDARTVARVKGITGRSWDGDTKTWRLPLTMASCYALRREFGNDLSVPPPLSHWAREQMARDATIRELRSADRADLPRVRELAPAMAAAMSTREYQTVGVATLANGGAMLLGDEPGLGKTIQALGALIETDAQAALIFCPRTATRTVWEREANRWAPHLNTFVAQGSRYQREEQIDLFRKADGPKVLICNLEMMRVKKGEPDKPEWPTLHKLSFDAIIADESHKALATTKNVQSKNITQIRYGAMKLRKRLLPGGLAIALSGTPYRSKRYKIWGTMNWLRPDVFTSFWQYAGRNFKVEGGYAGSRVLVDELIVPEEQWAAELRPYYIGRDKATVAPDLPPVQYMGTPRAGGNYVVLPMDGKQRKAYQDMVEDAAVDLEDGKLTATGILAEITRRRQFANAYGTLTEDRRVLPSAPSNKLDWILQFMEEHEGAEGKVVIASMFTEMVHLIDEALKDAGYKLMTLTGATSDRDRKTLVERFADPSDSARVVVMNMAAGGVAITLDQADYMILVDQPWTSDDEKQTIDRIHRVSRIHNVFVYRLVSEDTIDEWMADLTDEQREKILSADEATRATMKEALR